MRRRFLKLPGLSALCIGAAFTLAGSVCVAISHADEIGTQPLDSNPPTIPAFRLAAISAFADDAAFRADAAERAAELARRADLQKDGSRRLRLRHAAVNIILAEELEPACSLLLLRGIARADDGAGVVAALDRADKILADCAVELDARPPKVEGDAADRRGNGADDAAEPDPVQLQRVLVAFSQGFRVLLAPGEESDNHPSPRRAASQLSFMLEHENPRVVASATLWQASLRAGEDDSGPAKSILGSALADPAEGSMPYAFFVRLLRCRLAMRDGGYATALALLAQLEDISAEWFDDPALQSQALRAVYLVETESLIAWYEHLSPADQKEERQWCAQRAARLAEDRFTAKDVIRLGRAIPIVAPEPRPAATAP